MFVFPLKMFVTSMYLSTNLMLGHVGGVASFPVNRIDVYNPEVQETLVQKERIPHERKYFFFQTLSVVNRMKMIVENGSGIPLGEFYSPYASVREAVNGYFKSGETTSSVRKILSFGESFTVKVGSDTYSLEERKVRSLVDKAFTAADHKIYDLKKNGKKVAVAKRYCFEEEDNIDFYSLDGKSRFVSAEHSSKD